ncbi:MAG TPA: glycosyltransferase family 2 protein [Mucilaginibacter sp.]|nr:glycosyltransferase family 2 protein [Mucilaginibacter sp.]
MDIKKSISIVIPNYNGRQLLEEYLPFTLKAIETAGTVYQIIIVDDQSPDNSVEWIKSNYPELKLIVNPENKGFSYTCNRGIDAAQYELILLLNSDVKLTPDYFEHQWKYFSDKDTFGVMGRIIDMEGDHIQDAARVPKFNGLKLKTDYFYYTDDPNDRLYTMYLSGANALVDAAKLKEIGGFDELFSPFYSEDMELSIRAWRLGWKCYYEHQAICRHRLSATTKNYKTANWVKSVYFRNRFYFHALHLNGMASFLWYCQVTLIDLLPKLLAGQFWIWKSYRQLFINRSVIRQHKARFQALMESKGSRITLFNIVSNIKSSVIDKTITRFNP